MFLLRASRVARRAPPTSHVLRCASLHALRPPARRFVQVRAALRAGIAQSDLPALDDAIARARTLGLAHYELPAAVHHVQKMRGLVKAARRALMDLEEEPLRTVLAAADETHLASEEVQPSP